MWVRCLVILIQIWQNFAIAWWAMKVKLRVVLGEQRLHMILRSGSLHAFSHLMLIGTLAGRGSKLEVLILIEVALLDQRVVLLEEILLAIGRFAALGCTR